ncbi:MAG: adenylate kinase [Candidatus Izemoplasmatales bacterium]
MNLLIMGKPGAGKGTLASILQDNYHITHISTGNIFREEIAKRSPLGLAVENFITKGELVPDELTNQIVKSVLSEGDFPNGFMLDGYPRTKDQAMALDLILAELNMPLNFVVDIEVEDDVLLQRITGRRVCSQCNTIYHITLHPSTKIDVCDVCGGELIQREDDKEESVKNRIRIYNQKTEPLLDYYRQKGLVVTLGGRFKREDVFEFVEMKLGVTHGNN